MKEDFQKHVRDRVGLVIKVNFWLDKWVGHHSLVIQFPLLFRGKTGLIG